MTEADQAQKLAEWLAAPAGTAPPEDLDPEVLAAVYALRPDRAPAPRVSFDEIVGGVKSGPFVAANNNASMPKADHGRRGWFLFFVSSGALAAAAVGLVFVPLAYNVLGSRQSSMDKLAPSEEAAPIAAPAPAADGAPAGGAADPTGVPEMNVPAASVAPPPPPPEPPPADVATPAEGAAPIQAEPAREAPPASTEARAEEKAAERSVIAEAQSQAGMDDKSMLEALGYVEEAAPAPEPAKPAAAAPTTTGTTSNSAPGYAGKAKAAADEDDEAADTKKESSSRLRKDAAEAAASQRSAAVPTDYVSSWYTKYPDVVSAYAAGSYGSLLSDSRTDVAMDAAWRAATAYRAAGDSGRAMSTVQAALRRSSANTVFRSNLLVLEGDLYLESDRLSSANTAWAEAARLNKAR